ncbi:MAG: DUF177 domain-containing protein [Sphingomonas sp.]|nr:DUF177 domain-containing protein [Sphingomonas sp.]
MNAPEFSRPVALDTLGEAPRAMTVTADDAERAALARRFGLAAIDRLTAEASLRRLGPAVTATGRIAAAVMQSCVASGVPVPQEIGEPFEIVFRPQPGDARPDEEIELDEGELDTIFYEGGAVDLGEAVAQTLALTLDPYPRAQEAGAALKAAGVKGEEESGPFGALASLRDKLKP